MSLFNLIGNLHNPWNNSEDDVGVFDLLNRNNLLNRYYLYNYPGLHNNSDHWRVMIDRPSQTIRNNENDQFEVSLDVQQFKPKEISVKVNDNLVIVEGKHEERKDEHGFVSRQFTRKYVVPKGYNVELIKSSLSNEGVLTISAPKFKTFDESKERLIPIQFVGSTNVANKSNVE